MSLVSMDLRRPKVLQLDLDSKEFDDIVKHFGQRFFQLGVVASGNNSPVVNGHIVTPANLSQAPHPNVSATEIIAQQRVIAGRIPPLARGVIIAWALFNCVWLVLSLFGGI